jgi:hypothetical protein
MKVFARKQRESLSLLAPPSGRGEAYYNLKPLTLKPSFHGWLHAVSPVPSGPLVAPAETADSQNILQLSAEDFMRVNRATVRESETHRFWPRYVLEEFLSAEVINDSIGHYVISDPDLTPVSR